MKVSAKRILKPRLGFRHIAKKRAQEATKIAASTSIFTGVGYGMSKVMDGSKTPELSGYYYWNFI